MKKLSIIFVCLIVATAAFALQGGTGTKKTTGTLGTQRLLSRYHFDAGFSIDTYTWPIFKGVTDAGAVSDTFNLVENDNVWVSGYAKDITINVVTAKATSSPTDSGAIDLWIWTRADSLVWYQPMRYSPMGTDTASLFTEMSTGRAAIKHIPSAATLSFNLGDILGPNYFAKGYRIVATAVVAAAGFGANDSTKVNITATVLRRQ